MGIYRAAMDIGTNSCRLIIAEIDDTGDYTHLRRTRITRIGEGLGQGNLHISRAAMDKTLEALAEYKAIIARYPVEKNRLVGTQALREADNGLAFAAEVKEKTGFDLEIISGGQEAFLSYSGAVMGLAGTGLSEPLVLDIGAGSTELFFEDEGENGAGQITGVSAPVGSLRLLEKPMDAQSIFNALKKGWMGVDIPDERRYGTGVGAGNPMEKKRPLLAVGGTATTLGAMHLHMKEYDPEALRGLRIDEGQVGAVITLLDGLRPEERLALPGMMPGREDVMPWGLRILLAAMCYCKRDSVLICDRDLLYGALY